MLCLLTDAGFLKDIICLLNVTICCSASLSRSPYLCLNQCSDSVSNDRNLNQNVPWISEAWKNRKIVPLALQQQALVPAPTVQPRFDTVVCQTFWTTEMQGILASVTFWPLFIIDSVARVSQHVLFTQDMLVKQVYSIFILT